MSSVEEKNNGKKYWRSLDELAETPEFQQFVEKEFPNLAENWLKTPNRRNFLQMMGASLALAGLTACRWPKEEILPFASRPEGRVPGVPEQYATAMEMAGVALGLLVTSYDGRPIKVEGNPLHPGSLGAANTYAQASVLELYDPERSKYILRRTNGKQNTQTWDNFAAFVQPHFQSLRNTGGAGLYVLSEESSSPSLNHMRMLFRSAFPQARWVEYEPISRENERAGSIIAFGQNYRALLSLDKSDVVACLDADLLMTHPDAVRHARDFAKRRNPDENNNTMNRLYAVESVFSVTGSKADHRLAIPSSEIESFAFRLAHHLFITKHLEIPAGLDAESLRPVLESHKGLESHDEFVAMLADDLLAHRGRSILTAGPRQPARVHALVHLINAALGNTGQSITYIEEPANNTDMAALESFAADLAGGKVNTLVILGGNPVYDGWMGLELEKHLSTIPNSIHLSLFDNETSAHCAWHVPRAHYLESWGDTRSYDGTISIIQPLIEPLYGGKSSIELLAFLLNENLVTGYDIVQRTLSAFISGGNFENQWKQSLHDGIVANTQSPAIHPVLNAPSIIQSLSQQIEPVKVSSSSLEINFHPDFHTWDGRFANNGWLMETPDPMTKVTWDNAILVNPVTAKELGLNQDQMTEIALGGQIVKGSIYIMPGQADNTIAVTLGQGRTRAGKVGNKKGFNYYPLRRKESLHFATGATLKSDGKLYKLATTQNHQAIDKTGLEGMSARIGELVREATLDEYTKHPDFAKHVVHQPPLHQLWEEHPYEGHKWGMAIDLTACTGCNACVVACQAENNIPVVGKDEVARGREMHWIRIDRYFKGEPKHPEAVHQPVTCHHCENAPCEQVCPVAATVHDKEGLNVMVYNRCVGTRYCSNNCPYKVRRFNYFNNHKHVSDVEKMAYNPEVTVRSRGVMEKCTYCTQRINAVKIRAKNDNRPIQDGEITPACAQTCPAQAIVFGDLNDKNSRVRKLQENNRAYAMLGEINVRPRTQYLARITNPSAKMEGAQKETHG